MDVAQDFMYPGKVILAAGLNNDIRNSFYTFNDKFDMLFAFCTFKACIQSWHTRGLSSQELIENKEFLNKKPSKVK